MHLFLWVITSAIVSMNFAKYIDCLECFTCGQYNTKDGSITPCPSHDPGHKLACNGGEQYCMKYVNEGVTVRQCLKDCKEESTSDMSLFCCQHDGCNSGNSPKPVAAVVIAVATIMISYVFLGLRSVM